jgi:hypothetical protein
MTETQVPSPPITRVTLPDEEGIERLHRLETASRSAG